MKTKLRFVKSLLVMAALCLGSNAWADETRTSVYSNDFETSGWTAKGKTDGWTCNPGTTTANTFNSKVIGVGAGSGDMALVSPSFSIADDVKVVDVELKFKMDACTSGKSSGIEFITSDVNIDNGYVSKGTPFFAIKANASGNGYWGTITVGDNDYVSTLNQTAVTYENINLNRNSTGIVVLNARFNFTTKEATFTLKKTDGAVLVASTTVAFANTEATTLDRICIHAGKTYGGVTIDDVNIYSVTTSETYADYTVHFVDNNGDPVKDDVVRSGVVGETVNANSSDLADYISGDNKYVYANDGGGVEVKGDGTAELTVTYTKYVKYNYTINAVDKADNSVVFAKLGEGYVFTDDPAVTITCPWYFLHEGTLYYQSKNENSLTVESDGEVLKVEYTATAKTDVVFYSEGEAIAGNTGIASCSNKAVGKCSEWTKVCELTPGKYTISARFQVGNGTAGNTYATNPFKYGENEIAYDVPAKATTDYTSDEFTVYTTTDLYMKFAGSSISGIDYIYVVKTGDATVSKTITAAGWATYCSPYALDFTGEIANLTDVYIVDGVTSGSTLNLVSVKGQTVPANTGLLIEGTEGTCVIPVAASGTADVSANDLVGTTVEAKLDATTGYVLMGSPAVGFYKNNNNFTLGANTAYLPADFAGADARDFFGFDFDGEATGINAVENAKQGMEGVYNLNGQRVAQPTRGLYIVNGRKVVVK